ncbi:hypothetical protein M2192_007600 [Bradyrhizobium elkanii USDA 61]|jgi:hypothetical protein|uniref:Uncharacterized protein n=1 Tax=Bradyrhizobium elkanii TaxID=29448 RepID=A0A8I1Y2Z0_BRAEL|nr:hypothetical protein [Bradyrhizobium elkanii]MCS4010640.1 hypothetical protein [Bradyrhizobium elkanii USDA 61]MCP1925892.1 hypothetical protein [Bradyrhizobium elkanii]MCS3476616.1 hypothetical protein [Bradyrhizobium elkanii]MCS3566450.1 hypothetical protein [Bradyrhizobium elkanii]
MTEENKPIERSGKGTRKASQQSDKATQRSNSGQQRGSKPEQFQDTHKPLNAQADSSEIFPSGRAPSAETIPISLKKSRIPMAATPQYRSNRPSRLSRSSRACARFMKLLSFRPIV